MDDTIGELLETQEHFSPSKAAAVRDCLLAAGKYGLAGLPLAYKVKFGWCILSYKYILLFFLSYRHPHLCHSLWHNSAFIVCYFLPSVFCSNIFIEFK